MTITPAAIARSANAIRGRLVDVLRRDLIGPDPSDVDLYNERLTDNPSRWYLAGFLAPAPDGAGEEVEVVEDVGDPLFGEEQGTILLRADRYDRRFSAKDRGHPELGRLCHPSATARGSLHRREGSIRPRIPECPMAAHGWQGNGALDRA